MNDQAFTYALLVATSLCFVFRITLFVRSQKSTEVGEKNPTVSSEDYSSK